jgi:site-specific DNA-methyltransferase (adenine-specific)
MMNKQQTLFETEKQPCTIYGVSGSALFQGDCLDIMPLIPDKSVQLILADLPYGTTVCKWDCIIPFDKLWKEYGRIIKNDGAIVLTASQPFTSALVNSKIEWFKYALVWEKERPSNPAHAKIRFMKWHEDILIFAPNKEKFNPQKEKRLEQNKRNNKQGIFHKSDAYGEQIIPQGDGMADEKYLSSILKVNVERGLHPTQKPLKLFKTLISAFTDENDMVLDNTMGSGTTCLAAKELNRKFIGIEKEAKYYEIACRRCGF